MLINAWAYLVYLSMMPFCTINVHFSVVVNLEKRMRHIAFIIFLPFRKVEKRWCHQTENFSKLVIKQFRGFSVERIDCSIIFFLIPRVFLERFPFTQNQLESGWNSVLLKVVFYDRLVWLVQNFHYTELSFPMPPFVFLPTL